MILSMFSLVALFPLVFYHSRNVLKDAIYMPIYWRVFSRASHLSVIVTFRG